MTKYEGRKIATVETGIQTEAFKRFRSDSSNSERKKKLYLVYFIISPMLFCVQSIVKLDNATETAILIETLKFSLLSSVHNNG